MTEMKEGPDKITRPILTIKNLAFRLHVVLKKQGKDGKVESFQNLFTTQEGKTYLTLDIMSFFTLEIKGGAYSKDKSVLIDQRNIYRVVRSFDKCLKGIYGDEIFGRDKHDKNEVITYTEGVQKFTQFVDLGNGNRLLIQPAVVYDQDENSLEGVIIFINKTENAVELDWLQFESLYDTLQKADLFTYSQLLVNQVVASATKLEIIENKIEPRPARRKTHVLLEQPDTPPKEEIKSSGMVEQKSDSEFFGI